MSEYCCIVECNVVHSKIHIDRSMIKIQQKMLKFKKFVSFFRIDFSNLNASRIEKIKQAKPSLYGTND